MPSSTFEQNAMDQSTLNGRLRPASARVQPAIPYALTRPTPNKVTVRNGVRPNDTIQDAERRVSLTKKGNPVVSNTPFAQPDEGERGQGGESEYGGKVTTTNSDGTSDSPVSTLPDLKPSSAKVTPHALFESNTSYSSATANRNEDNGKPDISPREAAPTLPALASPVQDKRRSNGITSPPSPSNVQFRGRHPGHRSKHSAIVFGEANSPASASAFPQSFTPNHMDSLPPQSSFGHSTNITHDYPAGDPSMPHFRNVSVRQPHAPAIASSNAPHGAPFAAHSSHSSRHNEPMRSFASDTVRSPVHSHSSSATFFPGDEMLPLRGSIDISQTRRHEHRNNSNVPFGRPSFHVSMPRFPEMDDLRLQNAEAIRDHVLAQLADPRFADCLLVIVDSHSGEHAEFPCHSVVVTRSRGLLNVLRSNDADPMSRWRFTARLQLDRKIGGLAIFTDALRYLYGGPLPDLSQPPFFISNGEGTMSNEAQMDLALQYIAMGHQLQLTVLGIRGVDLAANLLHWHTIVPALVFALQGGLSGLWIVDDGGEDRSSCSSDDSRIRADSTPLMPTYDPFATDLLQRIVTFMTQMFPQNFYLDASAPHLAELGLSTSIAFNDMANESAQMPRVNPRLSRIRFGDAPMDDVPRPPPVTTTISSILLSIPFPILKCVLEHVDLVFRLGPDTVSSIMRQVVHEREARRARSLAEPQMVYASAVFTPDVSWVESVEPSPQHRAGFRVTRRRRGINTPASSDVPSDVLSEQSK